MSKWEHMVDKKVKFSGVAWKLKLRECVAVLARNCSKQQDQLEQTNGDWSWWRRN